MNVRELMIVVGTGCVLMVFGLVPGLLQGLAADVTTGMQNFRDLLCSRWPTSPVPPADYDRRHRPVWLAGIGAMLIVLCLLAYVSN